ncbi:MAG: hypothetical protein ACK4MQ_04435 [Hyphomonas sp.]
MRPLTRLAAAAILLLAGALPAIAGPGGTLRLKQVSIMDPSGFEKPLPAASSVVPADWTTRGGIVWRPFGSCLAGPTTDWSASSPDGKATIRLLPASAWKAGNMMGMTVEPDCGRTAFNTSDEYARSFVSQFRGGKLVNVERDEGLTRVLSQPPFFNEMYGDPYMRSWTDAAAIHFTYDEQGTEYTGGLMLFTQHSYIAMSGLFGMKEEMVTGGAAVQILFSAPTTQLADYENIFLAFMQNYVPGAEWTERINRMQANMSREAIETSKRISQIIADTSADISAMNMDSWRARTESQDRGSRQFSEAIRGVQSYNADIPGGQIELPSGYDRAFQLNDGTFVVTNDPFYDPYRTSGMDGRELAPVR